MPKSEFRIRILGGLRKEDHKIFSKRIPKGLSLRDEQENAFCR